MHSIRSQQAEREFLNCLDKKNPSYILNLIDDSLYKDKPEKKVNKMIANYAVKKGYKCEKGVLDFDVELDDKHNPKYIKYEICKN